ncbi:hypothetical protein OQA88_250 [Cercophora sp. LCS_1]
MSALLSMAKVTLLGSENASRSTKTPTFLPSRDIPLLTDRVILITGAAGDLGRQTAIELFRHGKPAHIYVADLPRPDGGAAALDAIRAEVPDDIKDAVKLTFLDLDLGSFESIQKCVQTFKEGEKRLDVLICNAGIMPVRTGLTKDGYELVFGVNYLGHALLTRLLLPVMSETVGTGQSDVRVVFVASEGHAMAPKGGVVFDGLRTECKGLSHYKRYGQSKIALIALAKELARECPAIKVAAIHPGRISTGLALDLAENSKLVKYMGPFMTWVTTTVELGARNQVWAATSPDVVSGEYYVPVGIVDKKTLVEKDKTLSTRLWEWTEKELKDVE